MKKPNLETVALSLTALIEAQRFDAAAHLLEQQLAHAQSYHQTEQLLGLLALPETAFEHSGLQTLYLQAHCRARKPKEILSWLEGRKVPPELDVYKAWALLREEKPQQTLEILASIPSGLALDWGLFFRTKGEALFRLDQEGWLEALEQSRLFLNGAALGRMLLDQGAMLNHHGQRGLARVRWAEALAHLEPDPYYLAWAHNSLGYSLLKDQPDEAEQHLLKAFRISAKQAAKKLRCKVLSGLAAVQRGYGEWERALHNYQRAFKSPGDGDDKQLALWGWGHTLRLMGRVDEALAKLTQAALMADAEQWIWADIAAAQLMLGEVKSAGVSLRRASIDGERSRIVLAVVKAEMLRLSGETTKALVRLESLEPSNLWVREELGCLPNLAKLAVIETRWPSPKTRVEVKPYGMLEVRVNDRVVPLPAVSKAGELLVFLLANGRRVSLEVLLDKLADPRNKNPRKAFWEIIKKLRGVLGWKDSLQNWGGVYQLDPKAEWICDLEPPLDQSQEFMPGYYSEWVEEWRQRLLVV